MEITTKKAEVNSFPVFESDFENSTSDRLLYIKAVIVLEIEFTGKGIEKMQQMPKEERDKKIAESYLNS